MSTTTSTTSFPPGQYGFFFDQSRCFGCRACSMACRDWNNIPSPGPVKYMRVFTWEKGTYPSTELHMLAIPCYHCANPVCVTAAQGAMYKEPKYGAVLIDPAKANSPALRAAWDSCPYGSIVFDSDSPTANASKCTMCVDRLEQGLMPICVMSCPTRALDFGLIGDLQKKYGTSQQLEGLPSPSTTNPAVVFKARKAKTQLVPYDATAALRLLAGRPAPLPPVMSDPNAVTDTSGVFFNKLNLKPTSVKDVLLATKDDMG